MELWIRSQDKEKIFKSDGLMIYCTCEEMPSIASYEICDSFEGSIATYKSKERALEVLDEIQNILMPRISYTPIIEEDKKPEYTYKHFSIEKDEVEILELNTYVYEMPKE